MPKIATIEKAAKKNQGTPYLAETWAQKRVEALAFRPVKKENLKGALTPDPPVSN